jgi:arginine decarboxylase
MNTPKQTKSAAKNGPVTPVAVVPSSANPTWSTEDSEELYRIKSWGEPYFSINTAGNVVISPQGERGSSIDIMELVGALQRRNLALPLLIRFPDVLQDRLDRLNSAFARAFTRYGYPGVYRGVFPVKCNQQRHLVENLVQFGKKYHFGLEAGSKPELLISLANLTTDGALLICNGYKDDAYVETAILGQRLGRTVLIVVEQLDEVRMVINASKKLGLKPTIGVRAKLSSRGEGRWGISVGDRAKFGLSVPEIVRAVEMLKEVNMLDCLQLLHFHIGSQISSIGIIKSALKEAARIYVELAKLGADMRYLDVGGGLAVDYDGSKSPFYASKNYNIQNYANDVVAEIKDACQIAKIGYPTLISESGRAIASHQTVLVFDVLGASQVSQQQPTPPEPSDHRLLHNLYEAYMSVNSENYQEPYHDAIGFKEEATSAFQHGLLSLSDRAKAESIYWACCRKVQAIARKMDSVPVELETLEPALSSIYYTNMSVFQSCPDSWAIDQLFPIMPIHRLQEEPTERATLADLTCDSDGKIDRFIAYKEDIKTLLEVHPLLATESTLGRPHQPYYLGMFLTGAYQEIMGNLHNLFGDINAVHISLTNDGYEVEHVVRGDTMKEVLSYVQYNAEDLVEAVRRQTEKALQASTMTIEEAQKLLQNYEKSLNRYTYLT